MKKGLRGIKRCAIVFLSAGNEPRANQAKKMKRIPLQKIRYAKKFVVANLPGMKSIIRVETARLVKWYHVMPATGDGDAMCLLIQQSPKWEMVENIESRIIAEETARYA